MRRFSEVLRKIVGVALASSVGAAGYACESTPSDVAAGPDASSDGPADAFADEATFTCAAPLPSVLDNLTPQMPVDYLELRDQDGVRSLDAGVKGPPAAKEARGTACATATDHDSCIAKLAALAPVDVDGSKNGWFVDADIDGPHVGDYKAEILVYTRGDEVGALRKPADVTSFLGTIDSTEEARLVLTAMNQPLVCTTMPRKSGSRQNADGSWDFLIVGTACGSFMTPYRIRYRVAKDGVVTKVAREPQDTSVCGRRPDALEHAELVAGATLGMAEYFAEAAHLEAASVIAFRRFELELRRFGAPASFATRARRSRADEVLHARETAGLARRYGGIVPSVQVGPMKVRSLYAFALENAVEGTVRETYGALVAAFQAQRASTELRPLLRRIARDEAQHAELAHDVDRWVRSKLTPDERARIDDAKAEALARLRQAISREPADSVVRVAGMPTAAEARILLEGLDREILAAA